MYHQSTFQSGQSFGAGQNQNQNRYQPAGFVQSQYQGQLSRSAASGPVTAKFGYQAGQQPFGQQPIGQQSFTGQAGAFQASSFVSQQQGEQHPVYRATNARQQDGPVIQQLGYQTGVQQPNVQQQIGQQNFAGRAGAASFASQQQGEQHPVYRATNARQQDGPVIQHVGYQAGVQQPNVQQSFGQQNFAGQAASFGAQQQQQWQQHPVYRATNARQQDGPVIQQLGYQAGFAGQQNRNSF